MEVARRSRHGLPVSLHGRYDPPVERAGARQQAEQPPSTPSEQAASSSPVSTETSMHAAQPTHGHHPEAREPAEEGPFTALEADLDHIRLPTPPLLPEDTTDSTDQAVARIQDPKQSSTSTTTQQPSKLDMRHLYPCPRVPHNYPLPEPLAANQRIIFPGPSEYRMHSGLNRDRRKK